MGVLKNQKLEILAQGIARGLSPGAAARAAGYNPDVPSFEANARQRACRPEVKARAEELLTRAAEKTVVSIAWLTERLVEVAGVDQGGLEVKTSDKLRALELLAKVKGFFAPEKREIVQRLAELDLDQLKALDERLAAAAAEEQPEEELH
jgi:hypothetical protein